MPPLCGQCPLDPLGSTDAFVQKTHRRIPGAIDAGHGQTSARYNFRGVLKICAAETFGRSRAEISVPQFAFAAMWNPWFVCRNSATALGARCQTSSSCMRGLSYLAEAERRLREFLQLPSCSRAEL